MTDDEQAIRAAITKRLTWQSHHMVGYESRETLLDGLQHNLPDPVFLDVKMPGLQQARCVKACAPAGSATIDDIDDAHESELEEIVPFEAELGAL